MSKSKTKTNNKVTIKSPRGMVGGRKNVQVVGYWCRCTAAENVMLLLQSIDETPRRERAEHNENQNQNWTDKTETETKNFCWQLNCTINCVTAHCDNMIRSKKLVSRLEDQFYHCRINVDIVQCNNYLLHSNKIIHFFVFFCYIFRSFFVRLFVSSFCETVNITSHIVLF